MVAKDIFPFATVTDSCKEASFMGFALKYSKLNTTYWKFSQKIVFFFIIEKFHEIYLFASVIHACEGENILCNHDSWLQSPHYINGNLYYSLLVVKNNFFFILFKGGLKRFSFVTVFPGSQGIVKPYFFGFIWSNKVFKKLNKKFNGI